MNTSKPSASLPEAMALIETKLKEILIHRFGELRISVEPAKGKHAITISSGPRERLYISDPATDE